MLQSAVILIDDKLVGETLIGIVRLRELIGFNIENYTGEPIFLEIVRKDDKIDCIKIRH